MRTTIGRWGSKNGHHWVELFKDEFGYGYTGTAGGGFLESTATEAEAIAAVEAWLDMFLPDSYKTKMRRVW